MGQNSRSLVMQHGVKGSQKDRTIPETANWWNRMHAKWVECKETQLCINSSLSPSSFELSLINLLHLLQNDCTLFRYLCTTMYRVWKNTGVNAYVVLVVGCTGKRLATSRHITRVRSLSSVRADVNFTYVRRRKRSAASRVWTHKRLLSCSTWILHYNELLSPKTTCRYNFVHKYIT